MAASKIGDPQRAVTGIVDLTRERTAACTPGCWTWSPAGPGRRTRAGSRPRKAFIAGIKQASLDPFRGYANAIRDELPDAVPVLDAFHVVKLGTQVVDEVRRRVQQERARPARSQGRPAVPDPGLLRRGREHLSERQVGRLNTCLAAGDPGWEVTLSWHCYQQLRSMYPGHEPG